jgi:hypothetical protein
VDKAPKLVVNSSERQWAAVDGNGQGTKVCTERQWTAVDGSGQGNKVGSGRQWTAVDKAPRLVVDRGGRQWTRHQGWYWTTADGNGR